ncbi:MAG: RNA polymerase sigma factor, partial [Planctomycetota bacterium]|nr:RNA polymerase sigma factor [Planctomycetota bacterium]
MDAQVVERLIGYQAEAYRLAVRIVGQSRTAEDIVQDAYVQTIQHMPQGLSPAEERLWFLRVVANAAKNRRKADFRRIERESAMRTRESVTGHAPEEMILALRRAMDEMEEQYRVAISLCYESGLSQREAARVLGIDQSSVSRHINEGLKRLRKALERAGYDAGNAVVIGGLAHTSPP